LGKQNRKPVVFVVLILGVVILSFLTTQAILLTKTVSDNLYALTYNDENAKVEYQVDGGEIQKFICQVTLTNHGSEPQQFELSIKGLRAFEEEDEILTILNEKGYPASFRLGGKESRTFIIEYPEYKPSVMLRYNNGGFSGTVQTILLTDAITGKTYEFSERFQGLILGK